MTTPSIIGADLLFVSPGWAHDIGNALHAAGLHLDILKLQLDASGADPCTCPAITALEHQLERLNRLMSVWVELSVPTSPHTLDFDLWQLLSDLGVLLSVTLRHRGLTLSLDGPDGELVVSGDRFRLLHASLCLSINVLECLPLAGGLTLSVAPVDGRTARCLIAAARMGDADPPAPDFKLSEPVGGEYAGTLEPGIAFALQTLEGQHGRLRMLDAPGRGKAFWFDLPLTRGTVTEETQAALDG